MTKIRDMSKLEAAALKMGITGEELRAFLPLMLEVQDEINKEKIKDLKKVTGKAKGGNIEKQMEMFQDGGLKDEGGTKDPVSGNDVPPGATQEEVRDDIPAQLSEGEFVFPADVVRYIGLEKLMRLRQEAKMGLKMMEEMGQMGNADEATIPDDIPFSVIDINIAEDDEDEEVEKRAEGGVIEAANGFAGTTTTTNPLQQRQPNVAGAQTGIKTPYVAPTIPTATAAPIGGFKYKSPIDTTKKATYTGLFGGEELTQGPDEYRTYVNDAGAEIQIPFKNGEILTGFSVPEGFKAKTDSPLAPKIQTARTKTARVEQQTGSDDGDSEMADLGGARTTIGDVEYAVQYNLDGTIGLQSIANYRDTGRANFQKTTTEIANAIKDQTKGQLAQLAYMGKPQAAVAVELAKKAGITIPGVSQIQGFIDKSKTATTKLKNINPKEVSVFDPDQFLRDDQIVKDDEFEKKTGRKKLGRDLFTGVPDAQGRGVQRGLTPTEAEMRSIQSGLQSGTGQLDTSGIDLSNIGSGVGASGDLGDQSSGEGYNPGASMSTTDPSAGMDFKQGGLAKRKVKPKKMKRGGLASKK
tara:strand:- start:1098 stop:2837 length:1740 start_codon:yes stop_codon:yes gene_type:complete